MSFKLPFLLGFFAARPALKQCPTARYTRPGDHRLCYILMGTTRVICQASVRPRAWRRELSFALNTA
jgi:hypothetical protein